MTSDVWQDIKSQVGELMAGELPKAERIEGEPHLRPLRDFVHLVRQAAAVRDCGIEWQTKHDIIFTYFRTNIKGQGIPFCDLGRKVDAETDVKAFVDAAEAKAKEIHKALAAIDALTPWQLKGGK